VYLCDFGLGKVLGSSRKFGATTLQAGTPGFQSPEQLMGKEVGTASDVYALGAVLTELFGSKSIWGNQAPFSIMYTVANEGKFPEYGHLPQGLQQVVKVCFCPATMCASAATVLCMLLHL